MLRITMVFVLSTLIVLQQTAFWVTAQANVDAPLSRGVSSMDSFMGLISEARKQINRDQFDSDTLLETLGFSSLEIIDFVAERIDFEPYVGTLKGPQGTLASGAGNALDQSILLAKLLNDSGYEARVVEGVLSAEDALTLVQSVHGEALAADAMAIGPDLERLIENAAQGTGHDEESVTEMLGRISAATQAQVPESNNIEVLATEIEKIFNSSSPSNLNDITDFLLRNVQSYFAVQYRELAQDSWSLAHPAFRDPNMAPDDLKIVGTFGSSIPEHLQHRVRISASIKQRIGSDIHEHIIMQPWERPAASLYAQPLSFYVISDESDQLEDFLPENDGVTDTGSRLFFPLFTGDQPVTPFDGNGTPVPLDALMSPAAGITKRVGDLFDKAAGALEAGEATGQLRSLNELVLTISLIAPGGEEKSFKRVLLDQTRPLRKSSLQYQFALATGVVPASLYFDRILTQLQEFEPVYTIATDSTLTPTEAVNKFKTLKSRDFGPDLLTLLTMMDSDLAGAKRFRYRPGLVAFEKHISGSHVEVITDIVYNDTDTVINVGERVHRAAKRTVAQGIWVSSVEGKLNPINPEATFVSAADQLMALSIPEDFAVIRTANDLDSVDSETLRSTLTAELQNGSFILLPKSQSQGQLGELFWSVDSVTGSIVARNETGRGISVVQYFINLSLGVFYTTLCGMAPCIVISTLVAQEAQGKLGEAPSETTKCAAISGCATLGIEAGVAIAHTAMGSPEATSKGMGLAIASGFILASFVVGIAASVSCGD